MLPSPDQNAFCVVFMQALKDRRLVALDNIHLTYCTPYTRVRLSDSGATMDLVNHSVYQRFS